MSSSASKKKTIGTFQVISYIKYNMNKGNKKKKKKLGNLYFTEAEEYKSPLGETLPWLGFPCPTPRRQM